MTVFILEDASSVWSNLGKHSLLVCLCVSSIKTGTRRIMRRDQLSFIVPLERRTTEDSLSRRIMRLVLVLILDTNNQTHKKCLPRFAQTDDASYSITAANKSVVCSTKTRDVRQRRRELKILDSIRNFPAPSPVIPALYPSF